jgi:PIN domain nuclease of toxin-antitoxin system
VLDRPVDDWIDLAVARPGLQLLELTRPVQIESCRLPGPFHGDPADQMIVATARLRDATILTRDDRIRRYPHVRSSW